MPTGDQEDSRWFLTLGEGSAGVPLRESLILDPFAVSYGWGFLVARNRRDGEALGD